MTHYICKGGCGGTLPDIGICEGDGCANQYEMMEECECTDGSHGMEEVVETRDSNGVILQEGDSVQLIKDLDVKGSSINLKRGKVVKKIRLIGDTENVEFKEGKTTMVLKTCYVKKV